MRHHLQILEHVLVGHKLIEVGYLFADVVLASCRTSGGLSLILGVDSAHRHSSYVFCAAERPLVAEPLVLGQVAQLSDDWGLNVPLDCIKTTLLSLT